MRVSVEARETRINEDTYGRDDGLVVVVLLDELEVVVDHRLTVAGDLVGPLREAVEDHVEARPVSRGAPLVVHEVCELGRVLSLVQPSVRAGRSRDGDRGEPDVCALPLLFGHGLEADSEEELGGVAFELLLPPPIGAVGRKDEEERRKEEEWR